MYHYASRRSLPAAIALAIAALIWLAAQPATPSAHAGLRHTQGPPAAGQADDLDRARAATRRFRDLDAAKAAGYTATSGTCAQDPKYGGMGIHYTNPDLVADGKLDPTQPDGLVSQPMRGRALPPRAVQHSP